jgi:ABC-type nitrate/sulfonate/bicarbonate transport system substrate-binding protein
MILGACGSDDSSDATSATDAAGAPDETTAAEPSGELQEFTFALTNQRAPQYYSYYLAQELGFFEEEGLDVEIVIVSGSSAAVQQVIAGNVDAGHPSGPATAQAVSQGNCLKQFYTYSYQNVFGLAASADSGVTDIADLEGQTVGVSEPSGGEVPLVRAIMASAGLQDGVDYSIQGIGEGGALTVEALQNGDVQAYSSSVFDVATVGAAGVELVQIMPDEYLYFPTVSMVATCDYFENNQDVLARFARAATKGTVWKEGNPDAALEIIRGVEPELFEDEALGLAFWETTQELNAFPPGMEDAQYGAHYRPGWELYLEFASQGTEEEGALNADAVDLGVLLTDAILDEANDFDQDAVRAAAAAYEG